MNHTSVTSNGIEVTKFQTTIKIAIIIVSAATTVGIVYGINETDYNLKTHGLDNKSLLSNGYDVKQLYDRMLHDGTDIKSLIDNHIIGETDPEISCIGSCSLINLTQANENAEEQRKAIEKTEEGYMKSLTEGTDGSDYTSSSNDTENLIKGLMQTGKFTEDEAKEFVK